MSDASAAIEIRPAAPGDIPALAEFLTEIVREHGVSMDAPAVERDLRQLHPGQEFLLAIGQDGAVAGLAAYSVLYPSTGAGLTPLLFLKELHVAPARRRHRIASRLMAQLARIARDRGCPRVGWNTPRDNVGAQSLYDGLGADRAEWLLSYRLSGEALDRLAASAD